MTLTGDVTLAASIAASAGAAAAAVQSGIARVALKNQRKELRASRQANEAEVFIHTLDLVTNDKVAFDSRQWIYNHDRAIATMSRNDIKNAPNAEKAVDAVLRAWSRVGYLAQLNPNTRKTALEMWGHSIERLYRILADYLYERRRDGKGANPEFSKYFTLLAQDSYLFNRNEVAPGQGVMSPRTVTPITRSRRDKRAKKAKPGNYRFSIWAMLGETDAGRCQGLIDTFAQQTQSHPFVPHITLVTNTTDPTWTASALSKRGMSIPQFVVVVVDASISDRRFRSVALELCVPPTFTQLRNVVLSSGGETSGEYKPHLSLLYGVNNEKIQKRCQTLGLAKLGKRRSLFVASVALVETAGDDFTSWRLLEAWELGSQAHLNGCA